MYVCEAGRDVIKELSKTGKSIEEYDGWLKDGYIVVNFNIEVQRRIVGRDGNYDIELLRYSSENCNMWEIEGLKDRKVDSAGKGFSIVPGDVVFYYTDERSTDDYEVR